MLLSELVRTCNEDSQRWFPDVAGNIAFTTLALAGEVGELANIVKKVERGTHSWADAKVRHEAIMEMTDVLIYLADLAGTMRVNLAVTYAIKRAENERRFGGKQPD